MFWFILAIMRLQLKSIWVSFPCNVLSSSQCDTHYGENFANKSDLISIVNLSFLACFSLLIVSLDLYYCQLSIQHKIHASRLINSIEGEAQKILWEKLLLQRIVRNNSQSSEENLIFEVQICLCGLIWNFRDWSRKLNLY